MGNFEVKLEVETDNFLNFNLTILGKISMVCLQSEYEKIQTIP